MHRVSFDFSQIFWYNGFRWFTSDNDFWCSLSIRWNLSNKWEKLKNQSAKENKSEHTSQNMYNYTAKYIFRKEKLQNIIWHIFCAFVGHICATKKENDKDWKQKHPAITLLWYVFIFQWKKKKNSNNKNQENEKVKKFNNEFLSVKYCIDLFRLCRLYFEQ